MNSTDALYSFLGFLVGWLSVWVAHKVGMLQVRLLWGEHQLNLAKTTPKIGTSIGLEDRKSSAHPVSTLVIVTTIYNEGELAASNLKGNWNLSCSQNVLNCSAPISVDHLGNSRPYKIETQFGGVGEWQDIRSGKDISININLKFRYTGLPEDGEQTYKARYSYDRNQRDFVRQGIYDEDQIQPLKKNTDPKGDTRNPVDNPPLAAVNTDQIETKENPSRTKNRREQEEAQATLLF